MKTMVLILMVAASVAEALDWKPYASRFGGWKASIPANLYEEPYSEKERIKYPRWVHYTVFESKDKSVSLKVNTYPLGDDELYQTRDETLQTLRATFEAEIRDRTQRKSDINYTFLKDSWFVVSGTNSLGFEFYTKVWRYDDHWIEFTFVYPKQKIYEPISSKAGGPPALAGGGMPFFEVLI